MLSLPRATLSLGFPEGRGGISPVVLCSRALVLHMRPARDSLLHVALGRRISRAPSPPSFGGLRVDTWKHTSSSTSPYAGRQTKRQSKSKCKSKSKRGNDGQSLVYWRFVPTHSAEVAPTPTHTSLLPLPDPQWNSCKRLN